MYKYGCKVSIQFKNNVADGWNEVVPELSDLKIALMSLLMQERDCII